MYPVLKLPLSEDLTSFSAYLRENNIEHHISEHDNQQVVWLANIEQAEWVKHTYKEWSEGSLVIKSSDTQYKALSSRGVFSQLKQYPFSTTLVLLSVAASLLINFGGRFEMLQYLNFLPLEVQGSQLVAINDAPWETGQWWRLMTPIFMHFSPLHLVFNMLWLWILGRLLEAKSSGSYLLVLVVIVGVISNAVQYGYSMFINQAAVFGGMSGVVYGLLGYCFISNQRAPINRFPLPPALFWAMLAWLILCMTGVMGVIGLGEVANAAHISGLVTGLLLGLLSSHAFRGQV